VKKLAAILTLTVIALLTIGYGYGCKNGGIDNKPDKFDLAFISVVAGDNETEIDVAVANAQITPDGNTINVYISNAYPGYEAYIIYTIQNKGEIPARFDSLTIKNPNPEVLEITFTDHTYIWLQPGQTVQGEATIHILEKAEENKQYTFQIIMGLSSREEKPRTIGFWTQQFSAAITQTENQLQIAPETLENWLDRISTESSVMKFTGLKEEKFQQALNTLKAPKYPTMEDKLKAQLLTLWLNYVAGWTEGYTLQGMDARQIIQGSEDALQNQQTYRYEYWKDLCKDFNDLGGG
jgi:hypothetical protein